MEPMFSPFIATLFWILFLALSVGGLFGNGLVICAVLGHPKMRRSAMNLLLLNLAIADLLNLAVTSLEWAPALWTGHPLWPLDWGWSCPLARYLECVFLYASVLTQLTVCAERFHAICFPFDSGRLYTYRNAIGSLLAIWVFVLVFALPNALFNEGLQLEEGTTFCLNPWSLTDLWLAYKWAEFVLLFLLPAICCALLHSRLCFALQSTAQKCPNVQQLLDKSTEQMRSRRRVVRMLTGCVAVQLLCYSPIQAMFLATALFDVVLVTPYGFVLLLNALALACSAANPLLYTLCSRNFRNRTRSMLLPALNPPLRVGISPQQQTTTLMQQKRAVTI